jgi:hypothetical protein
MENKILNFEKIYFNKNIQNIFTFITIWFSLFNIITNIAYLYISSLNYPINYYAFYKNFIFISIFPAILIKKNSNFLIKNISLLNFSSLIYSISILISIIFLSLYSFKGYHRLNSVLFGLSIIYLFINIFERLFYININTKYIKYISYILSSLAIFSCMSLLLFPRFLNYESEIQLTSLNKLELNNHSEIKLTDEEFIKIKNMHFFIKNNSVQKYYPEIDTTSNKLKFSIGPDMEWVCELISEENYGTKEQFEENKCNSFLSNKSSASLIEKFKYISKSNLDPPINDRLNNQLSIYLNENNFSKNDEYWYLLQMLNKGNVFHHYNAILNGLQNGIINSYYNQYGAGPLIFIDFLSKISNSTKFDSVFYSIIIFNFLILLFILFVNKPLVYVGYISSILVVEFISNFYAPMVYYIRYVGILPLILLLYLIDPVNFKDKYKYLFKTLIYISAFLVGISNKEYALLFSFACIFAFMLRFNIDFVKFLILNIFGVILSYIVFQNPGMMGANYLSLITGIGFGSSVNITFLFSISFICYFLYLYYNNNTMIKTNDYVFLLYIMQLVFLVKFITNPVINHLGPMLLFFTLCIDKTYFHDSRILNKVHVTIYTFLIILCFLSLYGFSRFNYTREFINVNYNSSHISNIFLIDTDLLQKGEDLSGVFSENDFVISRQDDFLRIYLNKKITGPFPNVSTNINTHYDISTLASEIKKYKRVLIDKELLNSDDSIKSLRENFYNFNKTMNDHINSYIMINNLYKEMLNIVIYDRVVVMETNKFVIYELKK